jgi:hypothetical protein
MQMRRRNAARGNFPFTVLQKRGADALPPKLGRDPEIIEPAILRQHPPQQIACLGGNPADTPILVANVDRRGRPNAALGLVDDVGYQRPDALMLVVVRAPDFEWHWAPASIDGALTFASPTPSLATRIEQLHTNSWMVAPSTTMTM